MRDEWDRCWKSGGHVWGEKTGSDDLCWVVHERDRQWRGSAVWSGASGSSVNMT